MAPRPPAAPWDRAAFPARPPAGTARHGTARHGMAWHSTAWHSVAFLGPVTAPEAGRGCSRCLPASSTRNAAVSCPAPASLPPLPRLTSVLELGCSRTGKSFSLTSSEWLSLSLLWAEPGFLLGPGRGTLPWGCWGDGGSSPLLPWGPSASIHAVPSSPLLCQLTVTFPRDILVWFILFPSLDEGAERSCWLRTHHKLY